MPRHHETRELPYSAEQMFALVTDIARYPEFLPWVIALRVRSDGEEEAIADMVVGFKGLRESFSCRVEKQRPSHVAVHYIDGPMRHLDNEWHFTPTEGGGCRVDFLVDFSFRNRLFETLAGQMFDKALRRMIAAFEERAAALYGVAA
ncbi:type II toxin-antitoxin system RatA family toxin [Sphingopyxis sp. GW247-27LB]|uniref:type II toxin-antitoxin system RatA family toxin n=1 Tax=Sphingopyxis sp. GW247-27LB TaxID=2012632 RepID=UPI000BA600A3|nr:type II toxin-antitoxin system RatA family toxin [Sphingopyxis sp. GW247-27LB]PAL19485.1 ubiquinone-binding protein [Sphingopyxis sp. GW247-27LB]